MGRHLAILMFLILCNTTNIAQVYHNPVFDRTDAFAFRVQKVETKNDTTFVHCLYHTDGNSWANISKGTILRDCISRKEYKLLRCIGLPYAPERKLFSNTETLSVILCFQKKPDSIIKFDIIESKDKTGFNIYGIDLLHENERSLYNYNLDYAISLSKRAEFFISAKNYTKAIELEKQALEIKKIYLGQKSPGFAMSVINLSTYYNLASDYENAIIWGKLDLDLCKEILGTENETYGISLLNLASYYRSAGKYDDAIIYGQRAIELFHNLYSEEHKLYAMAISDFSETLYARGQYQEAISYAVKGLSIREKLFGKKSVEYSQSLHNLALDYAEVGDILKAIKLINEALDIKKEILGEFDTSYISSLNNLANFYSLKDDYSTAIKTELRVLKLAELVYGINHPKYAIFAENISGYYLKLGNYEDANRYLEMARNTFTQVSLEESQSRGIHLNNLAMNYFYQGDYINAIKYGEEALQSMDKKLSDYGVAAGNLARYYSKTSDFNNAIKYQHLAIDLLKERMSKEYSGLDFESKYIFWQSNHSMIDDVYPLYVWNSRNDSSLINLYNEILFSKGITYRDDIFNYPSCKAIQKKLNDNDIAIEFISPSNATNDTIFYFALILKKDMKSPQMIKLFHNEQFNDSLIAATSNFDKKLKVGQLVWGPLKEYIKGVKNIYFSATHILHAIPIENLPYDNKDYYLERFNLYRLTSTSEIAIPHSKPQYKTAVLFGGLNYEDNSNSNQKTGQRAGFEPLFETESEVHEIEKHLFGNHINFKEYLGINGTELSFKNLSGTPIDIIHIATHGMYDKKAKLGIFQREGNYQKLLKEYSSFFYQSNGLSTSYLVMSGGNKPTMRIPSNSLDDGILTAYEVSMLDFSKTEIVSLSACESGSGVYGADDSIIGLQRGFKLAGALTILMALNKIDDEATKILMVEFYRNLMSGKTKLQSLKDAQKHLRQVENGKYDDPKYWASFIMLDGLN